MKKVFISVPMKYRDDIQIRHSIHEMHKIAEIVFGEKLEPVHNFVDYVLDEDLGVKNSSVFYLGKAIERMSTCDYFVGIGYSKAFNGCMVEKEIAKRYGIEMYCVNMYRCKFLEDAVKVEYETELEN